MEAYIMHNLIAKRKSISCNSLMLRYFNLIELLIVIAIITILIGLLFPALVKAKGMTMQLNCISNLKQVGLGQINYASDNNGWSTPYRPNDANSFFWHEFLTYYDYVQTSQVQVGKPSIFVCPAGMPKVYGKGSGGIGFPLTYGIRYHSHASYSIGRPNVVIGEAAGYANDAYYGHSFGNPSSFLFIADSVFDSPGSTDHGQQGVIWQFTGASGYKIHLKHGKKANCLFADGHVAGKARGDLIGFYGLINDNTYYLLPASVAY